MHLKCISTLESSLGEMIIIHILGKMDVLTMEMFNQEDGGGQDVKVFASRAGDEGLIPITYSFLVCVISCVLVILT